MFLFLAVLAFSVPAFAEDMKPVWLNDLSQAQKQAKKENKDILVLFTAPEWCVHCQELEKNILSNEKFQVSDGYVLVQVILNSEDERIKNDKLLWEHGVKGYPTVILLDADGRPFANDSGYHRDLNAEKYSKYFLVELKKSKEERDQAFEAAKKATGVEKANLLIKGIDATGRTNKITYKPELEEIVSIAKANPEGFKDEENSDIIGKIKLILAVTQTGYEGTKKNQIGIIKSTIHEILESPTISKHYKIHLNSMLVQIATIENDRTGLIAALKSLRDLDPDSDIGKEAAAELDELEKK